mgnify:CR=1 FL=1
MIDKICEGAVFHFNGAGIKNHFHIIVNINAKTGQALLFGVVTSHVAMRKQDAEDTDESPETIVDLSPVQCPCLRYDSVVDCNEPLVLKRDKLEQLIAAGKVTFKCNVSREITFKIRKGIQISKNADMDAKGLLY